MASSPEIVVAGHICLDIIPRFPRTDVDYRTIMQPGKLVFVDPPVISTGGAVANTGLALHRLGVRTGLMGKVGDDLFGRAILDVIRGYDAALAEPMIVDRSVPSSYTVVINPPNMDRLFLHCRGANDLFGADDVRDEMVRGARLFHFGYPPLMRRFYADHDELARLFRRVKSLGVTTSLDMAYPDPHSEAGRAPWPVILQRALPYVDIFLPSLDEMRFMLQRDHARDIAQQLLDWGARVVGLKLGEDGLYVRVREGEWHAPCFLTQVVGTTGAGDCTIAGFLAGWVKGLPLEEIITMAVAVGACNVEAADAISGIVPWDRVRARVHAGWSRRTSAFRI